MLRPLMAFLVLLLLFVMVAFLFMSMPVDESSSITQTLTKTWQHVYEEDFELPDRDRIPHSSQRLSSTEQQLQNYMQTRIDFPEQNKVGTVMHDGFHAVLPDDCMWIKGKIERSEKIRKLRLEAMTRKDSGEHV